MRLFVFTIALLLIACTCYAQDVSEKQPIDHMPRGLEAIAVPADLVPTRPKVLIPELTEIPLVLRDDMKSGYTQPGSEVLFTVAEDVYAPGPVLVLTKGTPAIGHVVKSVGHKSFGRSGQLYLTCDYVLAQDRTRIPLRSKESQARGKSESGTSWLATLFGLHTSLDLASSADHVVRSWWPIGFIGPVVSAIIEGKNVRLRPGVRFTVHTEREVAAIMPVPSVIEKQPYYSDDSVRYQGLKYYPTVVMKSGDKLIGVVKKDSDGKWATIYGPLRVMSRVLADDIMSVE